MDPGSSGVMADTLKNNGKDILEQPSLLCRTTAKNLHKTPVVSEANGVSLKGPITPASHREGDSYASPLITFSETGHGHSDPQLDDDCCGQSSSNACSTPKESVEPGHADSQLDDDCCNQSSTNACSTPKESVFNPFAPVPDGSETPRGSVFDPFAPCQTCPPTPGPVIPQRIRLW